MCFEISMGYVQLHVNHDIVVQMRIAGGSESEVGLVHNEMRFEIFMGDRISRYAPHCRILVPIFDKCWGNEVGLRFWSLLTTYL